MVVATASPVRSWLLIEVPGAWGVDAIHDSELGAHVPAGWKADLQRRGIRPICIRSARPGRRGASRDAGLLRGRRPSRPRRGATWVRTLPTLAAVRYVTDDLRAGVAPDGWAPHPERMVIVCTNGRHDQCCANRGRPVVRHLRDTRWAEQVWECSHIGGDRFAANVVVLPDSLYFGRMAPAEAEHLLDAHAAGRVALEWFRGRSTLRFVEQAAEHAVRAAFDVRGVDDVEVLGVSRETGDVRVQVRGVGTLDAVMERTDRAQRRAPHLPWSWRPGVPATRQRPGWSKSPTDFRSSRSTGAAPQGARSDGSTACAGHRGRAQPAVWRRRPEGFQHVCGTIGSAIRSCSNRTPRPKRSSTRSR